MFENNEINSIIDESTKYLDIFTATRYLIVVAVAAIALSLSLSRYLIVTAPLFACGVVSLPIAHCHELHSRDTHQDQ
jgi:hypothetical protein